MNRWITKKYCKYRTSEITSYSLILIGLVVGLIIPAGLELYIINKGLKFRLYLAKRLEYQITNKDYILLK